MPERPEVSPATPPQRFAETTPPQVSGADYTQFTLGAVSQLQHAVGGLTTAVDALTRRSEDQGKKLDHISHVVYAAGAVVSVLTAIGVFILSKLSDVLIEALKKNLVGH